MTNSQIKNLNGLHSFVRNIGKLSYGRSTKFKSADEEGFGARYGKVTCTSVGERPRKFTVSGSQVMPNGTGYTYKTIMNNLIGQIVLF